MVYQYESTVVNTNSGRRRHKSAICLVDDSQGVAQATFVGAGEHQGSRGATATRLSLDPFWLEWGRR
jgi:hypothetical protein